MKQSVHRTVYSSALLLAAAAAMPGCIVQEIRDDLKSSVHHLGVVKDDLARTNQLLSDVKSDLDTTRNLLNEVKSQLETTNTTISAVQERLEVLDPIDKSLASLDTSLKTVKALIEKIPFVGGSDKEEKPAEQPAAPADQPGGDK